MAYVTQLRNTLDDLMLSAEQIEELSRVFDMHAPRDMLDRLFDEIRTIRREILLIDADNLIRVARNFGGLS